MGVFIRQTILLTLACVLGSVVEGFAQFMQDDAPDGNSSLIGGTTVSVDVQKTTLQLDYTGKFGNRKFPNHPAYLNWGVSLLGGNSNRIAQLLQNGAFTPTARISGFVFHGWDAKSNQTNALEQALLTSSAAIAEFKKGQQTWFDRNLKQTLFAEIDKLPDATRAAMKAIYTGNIDAGIELVRAKYVNAQNAAPLASKPIFDDMIDLITNKANQFNRQPTLLDLEAANRRDSLNYFNFQSLNPVRRFLVYGRAGVVATGFSYFSQINAADIAGSFRDSVFTSPYIEVGGNFYTRGYLIMGLNLGYGRVNTLQNLSLVTYNYQAVVTGSGGQQLTSEREIQAYQGTPTQYGQFRVKADFIGLIPTGDRGTLALNPYVRFSTSATPQNRWRYGIAGYYFNRKGGFLGGLYAERTSLVTRTNPNTYSVVDRGITLGLRASYLLDTVFNAEKPR